jgi:hypothetical protein
MNTFRKIGSNGWGVSCDAQQAPGTIIEVSLKNGGTKKATVGALVATQYGKWVYAIAAEAPAAVNSQPVGNLSGVMALFAKAKAHLRYPAIVLSVPALGETIRVSVAGEQARFPGSLNVVNYNRMNDAGRKFWYGRVHQDGRFESKAECREIGERLSAFAADPVKIATEHGRLTGRCCFCNLALTDARSTAVGYGSTCAGHYGLPWGDRPAEFGAAA